MVVTHTSILVLSVWVITHVHTSTVTGSRLGLACTSNETCSSTKNSFCDEGFCVCQTGSRNMTDSCQLRTIGDSCTDRSDCLGVENSACLYDTCQCLPGYKNGNDFSVCIEKRIGDDCSNDSECSAVGNSRCDVSGKCECLDEFVYKNSSCVIKKKLGDSCVNGSDCTYFINNTRCLKAKCACAVRYVKESDRMCRLRRLGDSCSNDRECNFTNGEGVVCAGNVCSCANGYRKNINDSSVGLCLREKLGDQCNTTEDCSSILDAVCSDNKTCECQYENNFRASDDKLMCKRIQLNDTCVDSRDCQHIDNSLCENNICICKKGYSSLGGHFQCSWIPLDELECSSTNDCYYLSNNSICFEGNKTSNRKCKCQDMYYLNATSNQCLFLNLGDFCEQSEGCEISVKNSECVSSVCQCKSTHLPSTDMASCSIKMIGGKLCKTNEECLRLVDHSFCDINSSICVCSIGYYSNETFNGCLEKRLLDSCDSDEECKTTNQNSFCSPKSGRCECLPKYIITSHEQLDAKPFCDRRTIGDHSCESREECSLAFGHSSCLPCSQAPGGSPCLGRCAGTTVMTSNMISTNGCSAKTCVCDKGYVRNSDSDMCVGRNLHDVCTDNEDCTITIANSVCLASHKLCYCLSGFLADSYNSCKKRIIGDMCHSLTDCSDAVAFSHCDSSNSQNKNFDTCLCNSGYQATNNNTECRRRRIGDRTCVVEPDCSDAINNSVCSNNMCVCVLGYFRSPDFTQCHKRQLHNHHCDIALDCSSVINNSICENYYCKCISGYYNESESKCTKRKVGDKCTAEADCVDALNNSACVEGTCRCVSGYIAIDENSSCVKRKIFDSCEIHLDCFEAVKESRCSSSICACSPGYYPSSDNSSCIKRTIEDTCNENTDCSQIANSTCAGGVCTCKQGFDENKNRTHCVKNTKDDVLMDAVPIDAIMADAETDAVLTDSIPINAVTTDTVITDAVIRDVVTTDTVIFDVVITDSEKHAVTPNAVTTNTDITDAVTTDAFISTSPSISTPPGTTREFLAVIKVRAFTPKHDTTTVEMTTTPATTEGPTRIEWDDCHFTEQCHRIDNVSTCNLTNGTHRKCVCPMETFVALNKTACIKMPEVIGDYCYHRNHCQKIVHSSCSVNKLCVCQPNFFADFSNTTCHRVPMKLGDYCEESSNCLKRMNNTKCEWENNTCVCEYGYTQKSGSACKERTTLPKISIPYPPNITPCNGSYCRCVKQQPHVSEKDCICDYRYAKPSSSTTCVPVQTYESVFHLVQESHAYDYFPIFYTPVNESDSSPPNWNLSARITESGLAAMFEEAPSEILKDRYVTSQVAGLQVLDKTTNEGVIVTVLLHVTADYMNAIPPREIYNFLLDSLIRSEGVLGKSGLKVDTPLNTALDVKDYDECDESEERRHNCSQNAMCINTIGSFLCVCRSNFADYSKAQNLEPGRICEPTVYKFIISNDSCSGNCEQNDLYVGLAVGLFVLLVLVFITYEIIQRKKTFTARTLYDKFGTTKIKKLRQASMKRLKERKKRRIEENKKKKEDEKQKKDELKRAKSVKRKEKEEEQKLKQEEKKHNNLEKKERRKGKARDEDAEELEDKSDSDVNPPSPVEIHPPSSPGYDSDCADIPPGTVHPTDIEMGYSRRPVSPIEESHV